MKILFKVIGVVHVILAFLKSSPTTQTALKMALGTGTDASPVAQRLLTIATPKQSPAHTHTCRQEQKLRNSTSLHKTVHKTRLKLIYALRQSRGRENHLKQS